MSFKSEIKKYDAAYLRQFANQKTRNGVAISSDKKRAAVEELKRRGLRINPRQKKTNTKMLQSFCMVK